MKGILNKVVCLTIALTCLAITADAQGITDVDVV